MQATVTDFADIFSIRVKVKKPTPATYRAVWPCGSEWTFDRHDLDIPEYRNGEQSGVTNCYDTIREAIADLESVCCVVTRVRALASKEA
jgi:hypothetical protein